MQLRNFFVDVRHFRGAQQPVRGESARKRIRLKPDHNRRQIGLNAPNYAGNAVFLASKSLQLWCEKSRGFGHADNADDVVLCISCFLFVCPCFCGTVSTERTDGLYAVVV